MKIGELAAAAGCTTETVRYYEKEGLLPEADRTASNYRSYSRIHLERLRFVRNCRALDMTQDEIRVLLAAMDSPDTECSVADAMVAEHIGHVETRMAELVLLKNQLLELRQRCRGGESGHCSILQGLTDMETLPASPRHTHLG